MKKEKTEGLQLNSEVGVMVEAQWIEQIRTGDECAFEKLFLKYYFALVNFAFSYLKSTHEAEEVVQEVFADCWERKNQLDPTKNIKTYLFQSVKFQSMDILKHRKVVNRYQSELMNEKETQTQPEPQINSSEEEFVNAVQEAIDDLPNRAKRVYVLHRKEGLTYKEIAEVMDISPKTVESQMSRALQILRNRLDKFVSIIISINLFSNFFN